jgi:hypothetical protein
MISSLPSTSFISTVACTKCGTIGLPVLAPGVGPHKYKGSCGSCGKFVQWISDRAPEERATRRETFRTAAMATRDPTAAQLAFLRALGDVQPAPATMREASMRISALLAGKAVGR